MSLATWSFPTTIVFGVGAVAVVADHAKRVAGDKARALIVCDPGVVKAGLAALVKEHLEKGGVAAQIFDKVDPNPVETNVFDGVAAYKAFNANLVIGVGGVSPLDAAK